jgi:hypothetical protein
MKKDTKKVTKKTVKEFKPAFVADLTDAESMTDVYVAFGLAKQDAGLPISDVELDAIIDKTIEISVRELTKMSKEAFDKATHIVSITGDEKLVFDADGGFKVKKPNVFKRFWNWITRKK